MEQASAWLDVPVSPNVQWRRRVRVWQVVEVDFSPSAGPVNGVRDLSRAAWEDILSDANITILSAEHGPAFDSYVLSESSLFVYPHNVLLKTCGRSTPFLCLTKLRKYSKVRGHVVPRQQRRCWECPHRSVCTVCWSGMFGKAVGWCAHTTQRLPCVPAGPGLRDRVAGVHAQEFHVPDVAIVPPCGAQRRGEARVAWLAGSVAVVATCAKIPRRGAAAPVHAGTPMVIVVLVYRRHLFCRCNTCTASCRATCSCWVH